jgi:hypothetical protein
MKKYLSIKQPNTTPKDIKRMLEQYTKRASSPTRETANALDMVTFTFGLYDYTLNINNNKMYCTEWNNNEQNIIFVLNIEKLPTVASVLDYLTR